MDVLPNQTCPLCGRPNGCAPAQAGRLDVDCWCASAEISPEALARIPESLRGKACLCARCAAGASEDAGDG